MTHRRVAIVAPFPPPLGGMAHQANILADYLERDGVIVHRVPTNRHRNLPPFRDVATWRGLWRVRNDVDTVNVHTCCYTSYFGAAAPAIWLARRLGKRVVVTYKGGSAREVFERTGAFGLHWLRIADLVTVPSGFLRDVFAEFGVETRIVPNLYEAALDPEPPHRPNTESPRIVMTRGLGHYYNVPCAIRAFSILQSRFPKATFLLAGSGNRAKQAHALVESLRVPNVTFLGPQSRDQIHALYRTADIMVNSSDVDNFPGALLEAFLFGVPIATTDAGGIPYMVEHGVSARMVSKGDHEALAREMIYLLEHPDAALEQAREAQRSIDRYRWESVRAGWFDALHLASPEGGAL